MNAGSPKSLHEAIVTSLTLSADEVLAAVVDRLRQDFSYAMMSETDEAIIKALERLAERIGIVQKK
jgi:hypothetical protein